MTIDSTASGNQRIEQIANRFLISRVIGERRQESSSRASVTAIWFGGAAEMGPWTPSAEGSYIDAATAVAYVLPFQRRPDHYSLAVAK